MLGILVSRPVLLNLIHAAFLLFSRDGSRH